MQIDLIGRSSLPSNSHRFRSAVAGDDRDKAWEVCMLKKSKSTIINHGARILNINKL